MLLIQSFYKFTGKELLADDHDSNIQDMISYQTLMDNPKLKR